MVRAFMSIQGDDFPQTPPLPRGVRRALEAMRANVGHDWTIADLAEAAGQSGRTLQRQFRAFLGKTPWAVLSDVRFEAARRELLRGLPETKVMDVALRHGFSHYGRFSVEYRRRYDETPSITLKRQLTFADVLAAMPAMPVTSRDRPMVALSPIEAGPHTEQAALGVADELATALGRAGIAVTNDPRSTRYRLGGSLRVDANLESGWIQSLSDFGPGYERVIGGELVFQFSGPWSTFANVSVGRGLSSTITAKGGGGDVRVVFFRTFDRWTRHPRGVPQPPSPPAPEPSRGMD